MIRSAFCWLAAVVLLVGCAPVGGAPSRESADRTGPPPPIRLIAQNYRSSAGVVLSGGPAAPYNYGPSVLREEGRYRVWWCSQLPGSGPAGDDILYAESDGQDGVLASTGTAVFSGQPGGFDGMHTCDPSVVKVAGRYYLYYTGAAGDHAHGNAIGVASSADGVEWQREAGGRPIVTAAEEVRRENVYGAGQPSALYLDGWFYLMFTDTTASGAGWNGAGQFVLRARDAVFSERVEALTDEGFQPADEVKRARSVVDAFSADWMWVPALQAFAIAHQTAEGTTITFWDKEFTRHPYEAVLVSGAWQEGPGLVRQGSGHAVVSPEDPCGTVPVDLLRATALNPAPTEIRHFGIDLVGVRGCQQRAQAVAVLNGFAVPSPVRTADIIHNGVKVRVERHSVAAELATRVLPEKVPALDEMRVAATIAAGAPALRSPGGELGVLDDAGRLWLVTPEAVAANDSPVTDVSAAEWDARTVAGDLRF